MEVIPNDQLLEFNSDTLQFLRIQYKLDQPERLNGAIDILLDWLKKQDHIVKKDYSKDYLERVIIINKGSVEKTKRKLDKISTYRTLLPQYFEPVLDATKLKILDDISFMILPKMTANHHRVVLTKHENKRIDSGLLDVYKYIIMIVEYLQCYDFCNGVVAVFDYTEANIYELIKAINVVELQQVMTIIMEGYGMRIKGIHFVTTSKAIDAFIQLFKKVLSKKVADRIQAHKDMESVHNYVSKEIMPSDYGGQSKPLNELSCSLKSALCSEHFLKHLKEMQNACTNENYRRDDKFNEQYMGMPGSFRKLIVD